MFDWFKKKTAPAPTAPNTPEVLGLRLGGVVELDDLALRLIEPHVIFEGAARSQIIQAVGEVKLDDNSRLLRFYTDDDGFIQVLQQGGTEDSHVIDVKLWYFYQTQAVDTQANWDDLLQNGIVRSEWTLEGETFAKVWHNERPVAMTEKTWNAGTQYPAETDQFIMLYQRQVNDSLDEFVMISAEEKLIFNDQERALVISSGINLTPTDFKVI
ncbi:MAG: YjfK family protein [Plesiomonas sp.]